MALPVERVPKSKVNPFPTGGIKAATGYLLRHGLAEAGYVPKASTGLRRRARRSATP